MSAFVFVKIKCNRQTRPKRQVLNVTIRRMLIHLGGLSNLVGTVALIMRNFLRAPFGLKESNGAGSWRNWGEASFSRLLGWQRLPLDNEGHKLPRGGGNFREDICIPTLHLSRELIAADLP